MDKLVRAVAGMFNGLNFDIWRRTTQSVCATPKWHILSKSKNVLCKLKFNHEEGPRPANHRLLEEIEGNNKAQKMILRLETKMKTKTGDNKESVKRLLQLFRQQQLVHNTFQQLQRLLHQSFGLWARTSRMVNK